jgi:hypothetical protein
MEKQTVYYSPAAQTLPEALLRPKLVIDMYEINFDLSKAPAYTACLFGDSHLGFK